MFMNVLPTIVALGLVVMFVPESPRFYLTRGRLNDSVDMANAIVKMIGCNGFDMLTEEELRRYLFQAKNIGVTSFRAKEAIMDEGHFNHHQYGTLWDEVRMSLLGMRQVFTNRMYKVTIPLQFTYATLTLVTGEYYILLQTRGLSNEAYLS
jgi:hypothetical protein